MNRTSAFAILIGCFASPAAAAAAVAGADLTGASCVGRFHQNGGDEVDNLKADIAVSPWPGFLMLNLSKPGEQRDMVIGLERSEGALSGWLPATSATISISCEHDRLLMMTRSIDPQGQPTGSPHIFMFDRDGRQLVLPRTLPERSRGTNK